MALLGASQSFADQFVGKYELGIRNQVHGQPQMLDAVFAGVGLDPNLTVFEPFEHALETLAAADGLRQFDAGFVTRPILEIARPYEWPIDSGRRDLEPVSSR